jgi:hypothetical protein
MYTIIIDFAFVDDLPKIEMLLIEKEKVISSASSAHQLTRFQSLFIHRLENKKHKNGIHTRSYPNQHHIRTHSRRFLHGAIACNTGTT